MIHYNNNQLDRFYKKIIPMNYNFPLNMGLVKMIQQDNNDQFHIVYTRLSLLGYKYLLNIIVVFINHLNKQILQDKSYINFNHY